MVKKSASLAGRGVEILFGEGKEETLVPDSGSNESRSPPLENRESYPEELVTDSEEAMEPEWMAMLEEEAEAATVEVEPAGVPATPVGEPSAVQPAADRGGVEPMAVYADRVTEEEALPEPGGAQPGEELPPLATTPARPAGTPARPAGTPAQPEEELPSLATTPARPAGTPARPAGTPARPAGTPARPAGMPGQPEGTSVPAVEAGAVPGTYAPPAAVSVPTYDTTTPPAPTYTGPPVSALEPSAPMPPPREKTDVVERIERIRLSGTLYDTPVSGTAIEELEPRGPEMADFVVEELEGFEKGQPSRVRAEEEIVDYVGPRQRQDLWTEIDELYDQVPQVLSTYEDHGQALRLLQVAQDILMEKPRQFDVAKYNVSQVRGMLERRRNITRWTNTWAWMVFVYDLLWILIFGYAVFFFRPPFESEALGVFWNTVLWGGIGGVMNGFYGLYRHASEKKDFDKQYVMWYVAQPMIGLLLGAVVHLIIGTGFLSARGEMASGQETAVSLFPYLVACIGGFQQRFVLRLIVRIIELFTPREEEPQPESTEQ
jgi:hypothetical protein